MSLNAGRRYRHRCMSPSAKVVPPLNAIDGGPIIFAPASLAPRRMRHARRTIVSDDEDATPQAAAAQASCDDDEMVSLDWKRADGAPKQLAKVRRLSLRRVRGLDAVDAFLQVLSAGSLDEPASGLALPHSPAPAGTSDYFLCWSTTYGTSSLLLLRGHVFGDGSIDRS